MGVETLLLGALGAASVASTLFADQPKVPKAVMPGSDPGAAKESGATVRVGIRDEEDSLLPSAPETNFVEQRKTAQTITGLGRGGLAL